MKSIKSESKCEPEVVYPCLMVKPHNGLIVLMTEARRGTVIHKGASAAYNIGNTSTQFVMNDFTPYNGSICLEN